MECKECECKCVMRCSECNELMCDLCARLQDRVFSFSGIPSENDYMRYYVYMFCEKCYNASLSDPSSLDKKSTLDLISACRLLQELNDRIETSIKEWEIVHNAMLKDMNEMYERNKKQ